MDYIALKTEVLTDPLTRGYSTMTDQEVVDDLNTVYRPRDYVKGWEIFNATDDAEYAALPTDAMRSSWDDLCSIDNIDVSNGVAKAREAELFGVGTVTRTNLLVLKNSLTRAEELGFPNVEAIDIFIVRN